MGEFTEIKTNSASKSEKKCVQFHSFLNIVLIPSRVEYKQAKCDLWWKGDDFYTFQQSACSELRLVCACENISMKDARRKLYQPTINDSRMSLDGVEDDYDNYYDDVDVALDRVSDMSEIAVEQSVCMDHAPLSPADMKKVSSLELLTEERLKHLIDSEEAEELSEDDCLSLCVPQTEVELLSTKEKSSSRSSRSGNSESSQSLAAIVGIVTAPILGYYIARFFY